MNAGFFHKKNLPRQFTIASLFIALLASLLSPARPRADGCFVAPPFVWDKHRDINEPTQKAILLYDAGREDLLLQVKFDGPVDQFGWLVPVPGQPTVTPGSMASFYALSRYTQEHWEPRPAPVGILMDRNAIPALSAAGAGPEPVKVVEIKTVGAYEVAVLSATEPGSLERWLAANQFAFPKDKADVIDGYVKQHWYFVAIKIDLRKSSGFHLAATHPPAATTKSRATIAQKLATGELPPLHLSFTAERCVFPLKISSVNGTPSEVQVYVLSPDPLVERRMFEKKFSEVKRAALEQETNRIRMAIQNRQFQQTLPQRFHPGMSDWPPPPIATNLPLEEILKNFVPYNDLPHYGAVSVADLPNSHLPRFPGKTWWLTKQTWTFSPEEMQDLYFSPAAAVFAADLDTEMGYYAAQNLALLGPKAVPALVTALQSSNPRVRTHAISLLSDQYGYEPLTRDPRVAACLPALFHDPETDVRVAAILAAGEAWPTQFAKPIIQLIRDPNAAVRNAALAALTRHPEACGKHAPELQQLLQDPALPVRAGAFEALAVTDAPFPRPAALSLLAGSDLQALSIAVQKLEEEGVSRAELLPLLHNPFMPARLLWLRVMRDFHDLTAMDDLIPLLRDPEPTVQHQAWELLQTFTGQSLPLGQPDQWTQWWAAHQVPALITHYTKNLQQDPQDGAAYHDRACLYNDLHDFPRALADFRQAATLGNQFQDYSHYRIWLIRIRLGEPQAATRELTTYLKNRPPGKPGDWPLQVGRFLTGQITEPAVLHAADSPDPQTNREQHCEAWFYTGMKKLLAGDPAAATIAFRQCLATGVTDFEEYQSAAAELKFLKETIPAR